MTHTTTQHFDPIAGINLNGGDPNNCDVCYHERVVAMQEIREFSPVILQIETFVKQYRDGLILPHELVVALLDTVQPYL